VIGGLTRAIADAERMLKLRARLIMCFLRHLDEADAERALDEALPFQEHIIAVGLDSSEIDHPPAKFKNVFRRARQEGFRLAAHAGEEGPPEYVWQAIDLLGVDRIDHGNRAMEDAALVERLARDKMALTVCPLSNLRLCVVADLKHHPLKRMMDRGLFVTINSDDPAYFGGYMNENFRAIGSSTGLDQKAMSTLARNGFAASFAPAAEKAQMLDAFDQDLARLA
jgi:adenosine deaminase